MSELIFEESPDFPELESGNEKVQKVYHDHVPEMGLLGAVFRNPDIYAHLRGMIAVADFGWHAYGWVWNTFEQLYTQGLRIDVITVGDELNQGKKLDDFVLDGSTGVTFRGRAALGKIRELGEPSSAESYAAQILDHAAKRKIIELMSKGATWSLNGRYADDIKNDLAKQLEEIPTWNGKAAKHTQTLAEALSDAYTNIERASRGEALCVPTELIDLDKLLSGGLYAPRLYYIGGRPGQGKSAFLATVAKNAGGMKKRVALFSLEMANCEVAMRLLAMETGIPVDRQQSGKLHEDEWPVYTHGIETLADHECYPIVLNDLPAISPSRMRQELRRIGQVDLVIVDYVQLADSDNKQDNRYQEVDAVSRGLKAIAKEFSVPVLAAVQLGRGVEQRASKRPVLSDMRESGGLEQDADVVMFIYRPDQYEKNTTKQNVVEIIVAKQRNGPVGSIELIYRSALTKFENAATRHVTFDEPVRDITV